jgi:hypothetical protein
VIGLSCHRRFADTSAKLDAGVEASGPHDFAVRRQRASSLRAVSVHRIPPRVRDDREPPLCETGQVQCAADLGASSMPPIAADWHDGQIKVLGGLSPQ